MAEYYKGTLIASPIVRGFSGDTYGTHHSVLGVGGYMEVPTITDRDTLQPTGATQITNLGLSLNYDGMSIGQRRLGMLVYVQEQETVYQLQVPEATWSGYSTIQKQNALINNNNWQVFFSGSEIAERISKTINQTTHGFVVGDAIGYTGSTYFKIGSTGSTSNSVVLGLVTNNISANSFEITYAGHVSTSGMLDYTGGTLTAGTAYYVSTTPGKLTSEVPTGLNILNRPILLVTSGSTGVVLQYRGTKQSDTGLDVGTFTGYTASTQTFLDTVVTGATNIGYFSGLTGIQSLNLSNFTCDGIFNSLYNYYYRDSSGVVRLGSPTHNGICRRGYVHTNGDYSFLWNQYTGASNLVGWIQTAVDIEENVGVFVNGVTYGSPAYQEESWTGFTSSGTTSVNPSGSLFTGTTYEVTGPLYRDKQYQELRIRTICSYTPNAIQVLYDDNFIKLSGQSSTVGVYSASNGLTKKGQYVTLGGTLTGDTTINANGYVFCVYQGADIVMKGNPIQICSGGPACLQGTTIYFGTGATTSASYVPTTRTMTIGCCGTIKGYDGVVGTQNALPLTIKGGAGYGGGDGYGGNVWICGGSASGTASCTGGTVYIQGGTGAGGSNGRIRLCGLPARTSETSLVYVDSIGRLSCGDVTQQPVTICTAGNYTATNSDYFIGTCSGRTVFLPASPTTGEIKVVADVCGGASGATGQCIVVNGNGRLILDWANALIDTDWGSITFVYNGTDWNVTAFTAAPTYCT